MVIAVDFIHGKFQPPLQESPPVPKVALIPSGPVCIFSPLIGWPEARLHRCVHVTFPRRGSQNQLRVSECATRSSGWSAGVHFTAHLRHVCAGLRPWSSEQKGSLLKRRKEPVRVFRGVISCFGVEPVGAVGSRSCPASLR